MLAGVEMVAGRDYIDGKRLCLTGGSYAGYLTAWMIGKDHRFAAACSQRGVYNLVSMRNTTDIPFFNGDKPSQFTEDAIEFCKEFEQFRASTQLFVTRMTEYDLWEPKSVSLTPPNEDGTPGEPIKIAEYFAISEPALLKLDTDKLVRLRDEGWLGMMYAHMISLLLWPKILNRALNIAAADAAASEQVPLGR